MLKDEDFKRMGSDGFKRVQSLGTYYKYVNLDDGIGQILEKNTFKFTDPKDFNDPFDCNELMLDISISPEEEKQHIKDAAAKLHLPRKVVRKNLRQMGDKTVYQKVLKEKKKDFKVSCFSEISDDVLMWSHYADKHRGICIGFNLEHTTQEYVLYPVNYIDEVQQIDGMANTPYVFYYWVTFKADRWKYEKEIRAVSKNRQSFIQYPREAVWEVIFGCNVKPSIIEKSVKALRRMGYKKLKFFKMEIDANTFLLNKKNLNGNW